MARVHHPEQLAAERKFPFRVDIPVPPVVGLGSRLNDMVQWCLANVPRDAWENHGHIVKEPGQIGQDLARFYFIRESDADAFRRAWL